MKSLKPFLIGTSALLVSGIVSFGEIKTQIEHNDNDHAAPGFKFKGISPPAKSDAATKAKFTIVSGDRDESGGDLDKLNDGKTPTEEDQPLENFFFNAGTPGGRVLVDLGNITATKQINTYSWHPGSRAPQVYKLYASDGKADGFDEKPKKGTDPEKSGWKLLTKVDTRSKDGGENGGQYAVSISDTEGTIGSYRYLLFDIAQTEATDDFGNTFYSEIDVIDAAATDTAAASSEPTGVETFETDGGKYQFTVDTSQTPGLAEWAHSKVVPMAKEWYPKLVKMLPSEGYEAPAKFSIIFVKGMSGVANTQRTKIRCAEDWFSHNLKGEALGAVFHEMVHVVQQYGRTRAPGWLTEGIPDCIRWYQFEPQAHGADITKRNIARARYDGSYRPTANFLNWVTEKYAKNLIPDLNAAIREGKYSTDIWKQQAGHTVEELGDEWKKGLEAKIAAEQDSGASAAAKESAINTLTEAEKSGGWKLLFNGKDFEGWHNFKREGVLPGWQVKDGALVCVDPHNAKDLVTAGQYDWYELELDYNISEGGNSGIMYHVTDEEGSAWATGPEFQLEDNVKAQDRQRCGWLYALYQPPIDPKTDKPLDATKPVGEWNHVRLLLSREKCEHDINGVKYFEYVLGSDDFNSRVAKSKFSSMPRFAKSDTGHIALQGDHGQVSFRNIKIREIKP
jgi:hypothetical protein